MKNGSSFSNTFHEFIILPYANWFHVLFIFIILLMHSIMSAESNVKIMVVILMIMVQHKFRHRRTVWRIFGERKTVSNLSEKVVNKRSSSKLGGQDSWNQRSLIVCNDVSTTTYPNVGRYEALLLEKINHAYVTVVNNGWQREVTWAWQRLAMCWSVSIPCQLKVNEWSK